MIRVIRLDTFLIIGETGTIDGSGYSQVKKARIISVDQQGKVLMQAVLGADKDDSLMIDQKKIIFYYPATGEMLDFYKKVTSDIVIAKPEDLPQRGAPIEGPREGIRIVK